MEELHFFDHFPLFFDHFSLFFPNFFCAKKQNFPEVARGLAKMKFPKGVVARCGRPQLFFERNKNRISIGKCSNHPESKINLMLSASVGVLGGGIQEIKFLWCEF